MEMKKSASVILQIAVCTAGILAGCGAAESSLRVQNVQNAGVAITAYDTYGTLPAMEKILALQEKSFGNYTYKVREDEGGKYAILTGKKYGTMAGYCKLPDEINGIPVKEIAAEAFMGEYASEITLPEQIRVIGDRAFADTKLWRVYIANTDCVIGADAFAG